MSYKKINIFIISLFLLTYLISLFFIPSEIEITNNTGVEGSFAKIFTNNFIVSNTNIIVAVFTFGIKSVTYIVLNAYSLETASEIILIDFKYILLLLPHAVIEVPTMILVASLPIKIIKDIFKGKRKDFILSFKIFLLIQILILVAAIVESTITPWLGNKFIFQ